MNKQKNRIKINRFLVLIAIISISLCILLPNMNITLAVAKEYTSVSNTNVNLGTTDYNKGIKELLNKVPAYKKMPYITINKNQPFFTAKDITYRSFENYSGLDSLGRCQAAFANVSQETMPTEKRGSIGMVKPSGWKVAKYNFVDGKYLYNRCHLIGYQLTAENANKRNLITGTRYLNVDGMLPFENLVSNYIKETDNHVLYRVTPIFKGDDLVAKGVLMEARSVEDKGKSISFNVFCYNVQPGVSIDYKNGNSEQLGNNKLISSSSNNPLSNNKKSTFYIINKNTKKFHYPWCSAVKKMKKRNIIKSYKDAGYLISHGYRPCKICKP